MNARLPLITVNKFLDGLTRNSIDRLFPFMKRVDLRLHEAVSPCHNKEDYAYFPTTSIIHLVNQLADGSGSEILMIGREGFCGSPLFPASQLPTTQAIVIAEGSALRIPASALLDEFNTDCSTRSFILKNIHRSCLQMGQIAACNRRHRIDQQLCRWALMFSGRSGGNEIRLTQEYIASTLGVRREGISQALRDLQAEQAVECRRGRIIVLDREKLRARSCECHGFNAEEHLDLDSEMIPQAVGH